MRILITNAYTWGNKGDAGILMGTIEVLRRLYGEALEVDILTFSPELDRPHYLSLPNVHGVYENVLCPYRPNPCHIPVRYLNILRGTLQRIQLGLRVPSLLNSDSYRAIREADYVIACGGGYLGEDCLSVNYLHLYLIDTCLKLHKKVVMLGNSVEPSRNFYVRKRLTETLSRLEAVFAREDITFRFLTGDLGLQNVHMVPDMAFLLGVSQPGVDLREKYGIRKDRLLIGITVRSCSDDPEQVEQYISRMAQVIGRMAQRDRACFVFIPQVNFRGDNDYDVACRIRQQVPEAFREQFILIGEDYSPSELKGLIGQCQAFLGTRMHSNIFAMSMGVPTVAIAYQKKTNGIMHMMGLDDYVLDVEDLDPEKCVLKLRKCIENREQLSAYLCRRIPEIRQEAETTVCSYLGTRFPAECRK